MMKKNGYKLSFGIVENDPGHFLFGSDVEYPEVLSSKVQRKKSLASLVKRDQSRNNVNLNRTISGLSHGMQQNLEGMTREKRILQHSYSQGELQRPAYIKETRKGQQTLEHVTSRGKMRQKSTKETEPTQAQSQPRQSLATINKHKSDEQESLGNVKAVKQKYKLPLAIHSVPSPMYKVKSSKSDIPLVLTKVAHFNYKDELRMLHYLYGCKFPFQSETKKLRPFQIDAVLRRSSKIENRQPSVHRCSSRINAGVSVAAVHLRPKSTAGEKPCRLKAVEKFYSTGVEREYSFWGKGTLQQQRKCYTYDDYQNDELTR